jgi:hypothetical protein
VLRVLDPVAPRRRLRHRARTQPAQPPCKRGGLVRCRRPTRPLGRNI